MEVQSIQDVVDEFGLPGVLVYTIKHVARRVDRQCKDFEGLVVERNGGDVGSDTLTNAFKLA